MIMPMVMGVIVMMMTMVVVMMTTRLHLLFAGSGADLVTQLAFCFRAEAFHVMVVAFLGQTHFGFEAKDLLAVLAHLAVHQIGALQDLLHPIGHRVDHLRVVVQITGFQEFDFRMFGGNFVRGRIDPLHQYTGEQEIGEHDDALVAELCRMFETGSDQGERDAGVAGFRPAETEAFPKHARNLGDVGVRVRIGSAAPDHHQQGLVQRHVAVGSVDRFLNTGSGGFHHACVDGQFAAIGDRHLRMHGLIGVEDRGNVVLGVTSGKQHARHGQNAGAAGLAQLVQSVMNDRVGEFQISVFHRPIGEAGRQAFRQLCKLLYGTLVAAAMAADHQSEFFAH